jgi:type IV pilus assembly protein PilF
MIQTTSTRFPGRLIALGLTLALSACVTETPNNPRLPSKPDFEAAAKANTQLGLAYASQGRLDVAAAKLKKAIEQDDRIAQAHSGLGYVYWQQGDIDGAQSEYKRAIGLDGDDPEIRNNYGVFLCSQHRYDEGDRNFMLALKNRDYPTPAKAWTNAGVCARQAGDAARAEDDFRQALRIDPAFPGALSEMATTSYQQQNYLLAKSYLDRYFRSGPQTSAMLLLGVRTERALGNDDAARQYELKLVRNYPDSDEVAQLLKQRSATP